VSLSIGKIRSMTGLNYLIQAYNILKWPVLDHFPTDNLLAVDHLPAR
jgi:hypothetical protein